MAVKPAQGSGIGQIVTPYPEYGGPMALQAGLRAAEPQYMENITGGVEDYTGGLVGGAMGIVDLIGQLASKSVDPRLQAVQPGGVAGQPSSYEIDAIAPKTGQVPNIVSDQLEADAAGASVSEQISSLASRIAEQKSTPRLGSFQAGDDTVDQTPPQQPPEMTEEGLEQVTTMALQDYLDQARPGTQPKDYSEYIKEFSDATGLDVSGKPDKSTALMALGLALMQNKAGKGFDVGRMLGAAGEAGEKALPEFIAAKKEARALRAKAGEYALGRRKEDEAQAQQRQFIYVVPKEGVGKTQAERLRNRMMQGSYIRVNASELNALDTNEAFNKKYEFLPGDALSKMGDLFKAPESPYMDKPMSMDFLGGDLKAQVRLPKAGNESLPAKYASADQAAIVEDALNAERAQIDSMDERFTNFVDAFNRTKPDTVSKVSSALYGGLRGLGIIGVEDFGTAQELETDVQTQQRFLTYVQSRYAPEILQEAGKTISDADRQRVAAIVGEIKTLSLDDPAQLAAKVQQLHELVILGQRRELAKDYAKHNRMGGGTPMQPLTKEQEARYQALKKKYDAQYGFVSSVNDEGKEVLTKSDEDN